MPIVPDSNRCEGVQPLPFHSYSYDSIIKLQNLILPQEPLLLWFAKRAAEYKDVQEFWQEHKYLLPGTIESNWRGYEYVRIFCHAINVEITACFFPSGSYTDVHDHDGWNWNFSIVGELLLDIKYKVSNNKFKEVECIKMTASQPQGCILKPHQSHEMFVPHWAQPSISFNFHYPARPLDLS